MKKQVDLKDFQIAYTLIGRLLGDGLSGQDLLFIGDSWDMGKNKHLARDCRKEWEKKYFSDSKEVNPE